ncbi:MAG TPA: acyloxyacyl hydrolase [Desulfuromonadaceae bacterium]
MDPTFTPAHPVGKKPLMLIAAILMLLLLVPPGATAEEGWQEVGVRMGLEAGPKHEYFHQYDAFAVYGLPWEWRTSSGWGLATQVDVSAGALDGGNETGFIGSFGPGIAFNKPGLGIAFEAGVNADLLDRRQFGRQDFGSILLLGAYLGLSYRFDSGLGIGYRLQHLSNGHIFYPNGDPNPGLDMHMISVSWHF